MKRSNCTNCWLLALVLIHQMVSGLSYGQSALLGGIPPIQNYAPADYNGVPQNWCVLQDNKGMIYIGNGNGLIEFDGHSWKLLQMPNKMPCRSLVLDSTGKIYVGSQNELGMLSHDSSGTLIYNSLVHLLGKDIPLPEVVWRNFDLGDKIAFQTSKGIYLYQGDSIKYIPSKNVIHTAFDVNNQLYVRVAGIGLQILEGDSLKLVTGGEIFADRFVFGMFQKTDSSILIFTRESETLYFNPYSKDAESAYTQTSFPVDSLLEKQKLFCVHPLSNNRYALGTLNGGVILINDHGQVLNHINESKGLQNNQVLNLGSDNYGNLWVTTGNGLSYIAISSPLSYFDKRMGLKGDAYTSTLVGDRLYVGGAYGIYSRNSNSDFKPIKKLEAQTW